MKFKGSALACKYLSRLEGLEIGGAAHNPFNLNTLNVDNTADMETIFKKAEFSTCGEKLKVDIVAEGDELPFKDNTWDFVISSHVIEHFFDPVKAIKEWLRVVRLGGYIFIIAPRQEVTERERACTKLEEIINRHEGKLKAQEPPGHYSVWNLEDFLLICAHYGWNVVEKLSIDDKVGNGFCVIIQKTN